MALSEGIHSEFSKEFGAWIRIEPRSRSNDWSSGLQACTADPLWMLGRQWQFGEFAGEDVGSPVAIDLRHSTQSLEQVKLREADDPFPVPSMPLETVVEAESVPLNWRLRIQIGQQFERFIRSGFKLDPTRGEALIVQFRNDPYYPLITPPDTESTIIDPLTRRYLNFMAGRVIDGGPLWKDVEKLWKDNQDLDNSFTPPAGFSLTELQPLIHQLQEWYTRLIYQPEEGVNRAWRNEQLDYRFEVNPPEDSAVGNSDKTHLIAPDYRSGDLDWYSFSARSEIQGPWQSPNEDSGRTYPLPTLITAGGTSPRWWAFEDAATDFGDIDVATPDLAKLLLIEFVLIYGDDWYSVPLTVDMPALVRIDSLRVRNVFGEELPISSVRSVVRHNINNIEGGDPDNPLLRWELFSLANYPEPNAGPNPSKTVIGDVLLIPPVTGFREESKPLEEIRFIRDESANRAWGIEHTIYMNGLGQPVNGFDSQRVRLERLREMRIAELDDEISVIEQKLDSGGLNEEEHASLMAEIERFRKEIERLGSDPRPTSEIPIYQLMTSVPENWVPLNPVRNSKFLGMDPNLAQIMLRRSQMPRNVEGLDAVPVPALSHLLSLSGEDRLSLVEEHAVPRAGLRLQLTAQRMRWVDGKTYVWLGRKVLTGRGEGSSGLKFDVFSRE